MRGSQFCILFLGLILFSACKKNNHPASGSTDQTTGYVRWSDPAFDGPGLYYASDSAGEFILIKNDFPDYYSQYLHYKDYVDLHTRIVYKDNGEKGCMISQIPGPCTNKLRMVEILEISTE